MSISINNNNGIIEVSQDGNVPKSYFRASGKFYPNGKDENLEQDGFLINLEKDCYDVKWYDLVIDGNSPTSLSNAQSLLAATLATAPSSLSLTVSNNSIFDIPVYSGFDDSNFTIEWGAKMTADDNHPRAWSIGSFPLATHAVSIENGILYYWVNGGIVGSATLTSGYIGVWTYFTIMRKALAIYIYQDGINIANFDFGDAIPTNGLPLYLGSEGNDSLQNGLMSNFRWNDTAVYSPGGFTTPSVPLTSIPGTKLLIFQGDTLPLEITDNSGNGNIVTNYTGIYNADNPFGSPYEGSIQFGTI
jgi:hypothetical protein